MSSENSFLPSPPYKASATNGENSRFQFTNVALRVNQKKMDQFKQQPEIMAPRIITADATKHCFAFSACFSSTNDCVGQMAVVSVECLGGTDSLKFDVEVYPADCLLMNLSSKKPIALSVTILPTVASATTSERIYVCNFFVDVEPPSVPGEVKTEASFAKTVQILPELSPSVGVRRPRGRPPGKRSQESDHSDSPSSSPKKRKSRQSIEICENNNDNDVEPATAETTTASATSEKEEDKKRRKLTEELAAPPFNTAPIENNPRPLLKTTSLSFAAIEQVYMQRQQKLQQKLLQLQQPLQVN